MVRYQFNLLVKHEVRCLSYYILRNETNVLDTCD